MEQQTEEIIQLEASVRILNAALEDVSRKNEKLKEDKKLYEKLRCFTPREFAKLYDANLRGQGSFDTLLANWKVEEK